MPPVLRPELLPLLPVDDGLADDDDPPANADAGTVSTTVTTPPFEFVEYDVERTSEEAVLLGGP